MSAKKGKESPRRSNRAATNGDNLKRALSWILNDDMFSGLRFHGNVSWTAVALVRLTIFWMWSSEPSLVEATEEAVGTVTRLFGSVAVRSYQALAAALKRYGVQLLPRLWSRLHALMEDCDGKSWRVGMWLTLAVDGSRLSVPRTVANEQQFCKQRSERRKKRKKRRGRHANRKQSHKVRQKSHYSPQSVGPQMWLTLLWHIGQRMPWCWEIGPSYASEREHMLRMLEYYEFPKNTLFCADAGFVGYDFWRAIHDADKHFVIRVGGNVRLLKQLGYCRERAGIVYSWPDEAMKKKQAPIVLRLLHYRTPRGDMYLVTNVLSEDDLTLAQSVEIYRRRWGVELQFRAFKQTYQRSKLRSRTPSCAEVELHWSLVGLWVIQLLAFKEQSLMQEPAEQTSIASVLRILRRIIKDESKVPIRGESLQKQFANAVTDTYVRTSKKKSRNYPRRKEEPSAGAPKTRLATAAHKQQLEEILRLAQAA